MSSNFICFAKNDISFRNGISFSFNIVDFTYFAISTNSGAYSIPVPEDGEYTVSFQGDGYEPSQTNVAIVNGLNVKVDYLVEMAHSIACDLNGDGLCSQEDVAALFSVGDLTVGFETTNEITFSTSAFAPALPVWGLLALVCGTVLVAWRRLGGHGDLVRS